MFKATPMGTLEDGRFSVLVQSDMNQLSVHKLMSVNPKEIATSIAIRYNIPVKHVIFKDEKTVLRGKYRGMTVFSFMVIDDIPAPF